LYKTIPPILKTANKLHDKNPYRNAAYHYDDYLIDEADFFLTVITRNRSVDSHPSQVINSFSNYAFSTLMLYYASYINAMQVVSISDNLPNIDRLIQHIENNREDLAEIVIIYYHVYMMIADKKC